MSGHGEKLTRRQELAIAALLKSDTVGQAAAQIDVATSTLRRWMQLPQFHRAYERARLDLVEGARNILLRTIGRAARKLERAIDDPAVPMGLQLNAAKSVLDRGLHPRESDASKQVGVGEQLEGLYRALMAGPAVRNEKGNDDESNKEIREQ